MGRSKGGGKPEVAFVVSMNEAAVVYFPLTPEKSE